MSQLQLENMTVSSLETLLGMSYSKLLELKLEANPDTNAIELMNKEMNEIAEVIKTKNDDTSAVRKYDCHKSRNPIGYVI